MTPRTMALAMIAALAAAGCGGPGKEGRRGGEESARTERQGERGRRGREGERARGTGQGAGHAGEQGEEAQVGVPARGNRPRVPASPEALLGRETVAKVQQALADRHLLGAHQQGELDQPTRDAVSKFQRQHGQAATGVPDRETLEGLGVSSDQAYGTERGGKR